MSVLSTSPLPKAGSLSDARSPGVAAAVAAAAASAAAGASSGGAPPPLAAGGVGGGVVSRQQQQQGGSSIAASEGAVSDTGATIASSTTAGGLDSVSLADSALAGGVGAGSAQHPLVGVPGPANLSALKTGGAAAAAATAAYYSHGLPCAVEVLSFLIDCIAQRRGDGDGMGGAGGAGGGGSGAGGASRGWWRRIDVGCWLKQGLCALCRQPQGWGAFTGSDFSAPSCGWHQQGEPP